MVVGQGSETMQGSEARGQGLGGQEILVCELLSLVN